MEIGQDGSFTSANKNVSIDDKNTTNIFISNLSPKVRVFFHFQANNHYANRENYF